MRGDILFTMFMPGIYFNPAGSHTNGMVIAADVKGSPHDSMTTPFERPAPTDFQT